MNFNKKENKSHNVISLLKKKKKKKITINKMKY